MFECRYVLLPIYAEKGVKSLSSFFNLANFDVVEGVPVDYMQCVLENTVTLLMRLCMHG